ncbi:MAG: ATP-dependent DNA helicase RecG [Clostridia bacterium]|nr:ATP-dependent DNA helicase RecG [Clostridia bacterium]
MTKGADASPLRALPGVGPARLAQLQQLGLFSLSDLVHYYPRGYEDRTHFCPIDGLQEGAAVCVRATVCQPVLSRRLPGGRTMARGAVADETGRAELVFFNQPYVRLEEGADYIFFGAPQIKNGRKSLINPAFERADGKDSAAGKLLPIYPHPGALRQKQLRTWVRLALEQTRGQFPEVLPPEPVAKYRLWDRERALWGIHFPESAEDVRQARRRLIFEELFRFSLAGSLLRQRGKGLPAARLQPRDPDDFFRSLPFAPTGAQRRAVAECFADLCSGERMNRLLQGDVGSGKTLVAAACAWLSWESGMQCAVMAPTELLARQHQATLSKFLEPFGVPVLLLCGATGAAERRSILQRCAAGEPLVLCGTHALIQSDVVLPNAGLVVVDEQHRFGVEQRAQLGRQSGSAHLLAMSATPIPRTLTLILYGDLDVSVLDELPPGRTPVKTVAIGPDKRERMLDFIRKQAAAGGQTYVVCPRIGGEEEDEEDEIPPAQALKAAVDYARELEQALSPLRVGLLHGRMNAREKDAVMGRFAAGELDVLVSTTVIEVGVDVPRANLMIVEDADRFGLSQLHQLRGRVGRGSLESYCILVSGSEGETARERLSLLCRTDDGFRVAEADLRLRGPGDFFGKRQHGLPAFALADLGSDMNILTCAQESARALLARDPALESVPRLRDETEDYIRRTLAGSMN